MSKDVNLFLDGSAEGQSGRFVVAITKKQQPSGGFRIGEVVQGTTRIMQYPEREFADDYRAGSLKLAERGKGKTEAAPTPWIIPPPDMQTMRT